MKNTTTATPNHYLLEKKSTFQTPHLGDWIFAIVMIAFAFFAHLKLSPYYSDWYEQAIFFGALAVALWLGWFFKPLRVFIPLSMVCAYLSITLYQGQFANADNRFFLKYLLSSQSLIMWQCSLNILAFVCFLVGAIMDTIHHSSQNNLPIRTGVKLAWTAGFAGFAGLLVRWYESYLLRPDAGHIPVSNLYEVFILFMIIVALMFLYYARKYQLQRLGVFVYLLQVVLVGFVLWYSITRNAQEILPLIPALQSWWMKLHVPANFIGYGGFCVAAMLAGAELLAIRKEDKAKRQGSNPKQGFLPPSEQLEDIMYQAIAVGFLFFTIATILGALWAGQAWGRYWSWDPKETWAFIVWLNYAVWLHMRLVAGWRGKILAWWALTGIFVTTFAFLGVNMFLSGLHSYGGL